MYYVQNLNKLPIEKYVKFKKEDKIYFDYIKSLKTKIDPIDDLSFSSFCR